MGFIQSKPTNVGGWIGRWLDPARIFSKEKRSTDQKWGDILDPMGFTGDHHDTHILGPSRGEMDVPDATFGSNYTPQYADGSNPPGQIAPGQAPTAASGTVFGGQVPLSAIQFQPPPQFQQMQQQQQGAQPMVSPWNSIASK